MHTLLREAAAIVAGDLAAKDQTLTLDLELPPDCHVSGDAARLQQVFWNLLKNGAKFSPRGGKIHLRASLGAVDQAAGAQTDDPGRRRVVIQVVDNGAGISADDLQRIFQPFEQAALARRRDGHAGLGLGLSIARAITELHDGTIQVRSDGRRHRCHAPRQPLSASLPDASADFRRSASARACSSSSRNCRIPSSEMPCVKRSWKCRAMNSSNLIQ